MDYGLIVQALFNALSASSILVLASLGLAVIFGMMGVINLAHGEFLMLGAYVTYLIAALGGHVWIGILAAPLAVGMVGVAIERGIVRWLYGRPVDTLLATWGLSITLTQLVRIVFGPEGKPLPTLLAGSVSLLGQEFPAYRLLLMGLTAAILLIVYAIFRHTNFGLRARAVIANPGMAACLGVATPRIYAATFGLGAALAGLAGALLTPLVNVEPTMGLKIIVRTFMVVVAGGAEMLAGTVVAGTLLGSTESIVSFFSTAYFGNVALLLLAIVIIRSRPSGLIAREWKP